jgi:predicted nucleic acid-binding protein
MKRYLLDNGIVVAFMKGRPGALRLVQPWMAAHEAATSVVVYGEAIEYFKGQTGYAKFRAGLRTFLREVTPLRLTYPILERYADLRLVLRPQGQLIGDIDTLIAATALEYPPHARHTRQRFRAHPRPHADAPRPRGPTIGCGGEHDHAAQGAAARLAAFDAARPAC